MEERKLIEAEWGVTENQRQARYYKITAQGRAHLKAQTAQWLRYAETVTDDPHRSRRNRPESHAVHDPSRHPQVLSHRAAAR